MYDRSRAGHTARATTLAHSQNTGQYYLFRQPLRGAREARCVYGIGKQAHTRYEAWARDDLVRCYPPGPWKPGSLLDWQLGLIAAQPDGAQLMGVAGWVESNAQPRSIRFDFSVGDHERQALCRKLRASYG